MNLQQLLQADTSDSICMVKFSTLDAPRCSPASKRFVYPVSWQSWLFPLIKEYQIVTFKNLLILLSKCHAQAFQMGWWSDCPPKDDPAFKWYLATKLCLIHSEIDEAAAMGMDDHLPHRSAFEVELADTVIRAMDMIGFIGTPDDCEMTPFFSNGTESLLNVLHQCASRAMEFMRKGHSDGMVRELYRLIVTVQRCQGEFCVDIHAAMVEKLEYNARRADHQLVNRQADGGKSF